MDKRANCDSAGGSNCIIVAGYVNGTVDLGGGPRWAVGGGSDDFVVAKYTAAGAHLWSRVLGGANMDRATAVAVDANGDVVVTGSSRSASADFGGGALTGSGVDDDIIVAKYAGIDGTHVWSRRIGGSGYDRGYGVAVDPTSGDVVVVGSFGPPADFGGGPLTNPWGIANDLFVAKYAGANGAYRWAKNFSNTTSSVARAVAVDASGNIALTGNFMGTMDVGAGSMNGYAQNNILVAKFTSTGVAMWSKSLGNIDGDDRGNAIAMDGSGNVAVTGTFRYPADFGGGLLQADSTGDMFVAKYAAATGAYIWAHRGGAGAQWDSGQGIATDASGNVVVTGFFEGTSDFDGRSLVSTGGQDIFVAKYAAAAPGTLLWVMPEGGLLGDQGQAAATDSAGNVVVTGFFQGIVNFGGGALYSAGSLDAFVLKLAP